MKRGGQIIFAGPLGHHSHKLIEYFEVGVFILVMLFLLASNRQIEEIFSFIGMAIELKHITGCPRDSKN